MKLIRNLLIGILLLISFQSFSQEKSSGKKNYVVLTQKIPKLKPILLTAESLKKEDGKNFGDFQIIICGKSIGDITDPEKIQDFMDQASQLGVNIVACGFSLHKFGIEEDKVPPQIKIVKNGILYDLQLQKKGYFSISL